MALIPPRMPFIHDQPEGFTLAGLLSKFGSTWLRGLLLATPIGWLLLVPPALRRLAAVRKFLPWGSGTRPAAAAAAKSR